MANDAVEKKKVSVDVAEFVRTRDALTSSYMGLSAAIDRAVKAYIEHTEVVLAGDASLKISYLAEPFAAITAPQQLAQLALAQQNGTSSGIAKGEDGSEELTKTGRKKRAYKPRDPNAPKRPLTAYFRFLQEMRGPVAEEMAKSRGKDAGPSKPGDVSKEATARWRAMSKEQQAPYKEAYQRCLKDYEKEVEVYRKTVGELPEDEELEVEAELDAKPSKEAADNESTDEDEDEDDDEDDDEEDEEEDAKNMPPPPPPKAPTPEPKKTPKSALKKNKKTVAAKEDDVPPTPQFSSINPSGSSQTSSSSKKDKSSSPELKRKAAPASAAEDGEGKKKRKKAADKKEEKAAEPIVASSDASEGKSKKEKKRRRKSEA